MGGNVLSEFFKSQQDRERVKQVEQLRRRGHNFIKVHYAGKQQPMIDSEGTVYNIRIHGLRDVEAFEKTDVNTGKTEWHSRPGSHALNFRQTSSGDIEADIWDDPDLYNRHFIATHSELEVTDAALAREIRDLLGKPFKVELSEVEILEREIAAKQRELAAKKGLTETPREEAAAFGGRPMGAKDIKPRKRRKAGKRGVNKSTSGVDSPGMSRVATNGNREGDLAAVQSGSPDTEYGGEGTKPII